MEVVEEITTVYRARFQSDGGLTATQEGQVIDAGLAIIRDRWLRSAISEFPGLTIIMKRDVNLFDGYRYIRPSEVQLRFLTNLVAELRWCYRVDNAFRDIPNLQSIVVATGATMTDHKCGKSWTIDPVMEDTGENV